jgi:hypothetical protein
MPVLFTGEKNLLSNALWVREYQLAAQYGCKPVVAVNVRLVEMFVHRVPSARPCGPGQDSGHDGDQQRFGGGMLSHCPPRNRTARF